VDPGTGRYGPNDGRAVVAARLGKTRGAVTTRRNKLRHPLPKPTINRGAHWNAQESKLLQAQYPVVKNTADLLPLFPRFTQTQIQSRARYLGLKKSFRGDCDVPISGHMELIDQIRIRAREDGVPLSKIDAALKTRFYFTRNWKRQKQANLRAVAKAVEYFGGTLVIDWRDR
jgi:hypothetical protein